MFGERLRTYRILRKMSQETLAEYMGFPHNTISKIENGGRKVSLEEAVRFSEILNISLLDLAGVPEFAPDIQELKSAASQCVKSVREAVRALDDAQAVANNLERTLALPSL